jgi:hypothetical protein
MSSYAVDFSCQSDRTEVNPYYNDNQPWADMCITIGNETYCAQWWNDVPDVPSTLNASTLPLFKNISSPEVLNVNSNHITWNELLKIFEDAVK